MLPKKNCDFEDFIAKKITLVLGDSIEKKKAVILMEFFYREIRYNGLFTEYLGKEIIGELFIQN